MSLKGGWMFLPLKDEQKEKIKKEAGFFTNVILRVFQSVFIFGVVMVLLVGSIWKIHLSLS